MSSEKRPLLLEAQADEAVSAIHEAKALGNLACPIIFTLLMEFLPGLVNIMLVGQMDSNDTKEYVDAAAISAMYINITALSVGMGMASAIDTLCTQAFGAGNLKKFGDFLQGALLGMTLTFAPVALLSWFAEPILLALGQDAKISMLAGTFTQLSLVGIPFVFVYEIIKRMLQAHSIVNPMAIMVVVANVIHIGLGYYLVHYTSYGFNGAAIARSASYIALPLMMLGYMIYNPVHKQWEISVSLNQAIAELPDFFAYGVPGMLMMMLEWCAFEILTLMSGLMPNPVLSIGVTSILSQILSIAYLVHCGLSIAATIRIGNFVGANKPLHAKAVMKATYCLIAVCMVFMLLALYLLRNVLPALFVKDTQLVEAAAATIIFVLPGHVLDGTNAVSQGVFRALGQQTLATVINGAAFYVIGIPVAWLFGFYFVWGVVGLWIGFMSGSLTACILYIILLWRMDWHKITLEASQKYCQ